MHNVLEAIVSKKNILILILVLAATLRLWNLGSVPPSTSNDEASIGYNAYSVSKIGVDEYGKFPLISQRAYDDWRRSTYLLLVVPFVFALGLHSVPIRLPAVILSVLTVLATYYLVLSLFRKQSRLREITALIASLLLAISPWHIYISRLGHESNAYLSFFVLGMLYFLQGIDRWKKMFLSFLFFTLSMISYYAGQVIVPLMAIGLLATYWKNLLQLVRTDKRVLFGFLGFVLILIPILWAIFSPEALIRFHGTSTFDVSAHPQEFSEMVLHRNEAVAAHDLIGMIRYNRRIFPIQVFIEGYISHFSPAWLFTNSGQESFKIPNMGLLNMWEIPLIIIGLLAFLYHKDIDVKAKKLIFLWFFLAAVPASIATQAPHAMRAYAFLPVWQIFSAFGLAYMIFNARKFKMGVVLIFLAFVIYDLRSLYINYFVIFPRAQSASFYYAVSKAIPYVLSRSNQYESVVFSNEGNLYQSYMDFLYYSQYDPSLYQKQGGTISGGFAETHRVGKYQFRPIHWQSEKTSGKTLYIGNVSDFPNGTQMATFTSLDGKPTIVAATKL